MSEPALLTLLLLATRLGSLDTEPKADLGFVGVSNKAIAWEMRLDDIRSCDKLMEILGRTCIRRNRVLPPKNGL
jgi:hypothetical protein